MDRSITKVADRPTSWVPFPSLEQFSKEQSEKKSMRKYQTVFLAKWSSMSLNTGCLCWKKIHSWGLERKYLVWILGEVKSNKKDESLKRAKMCYSVKTNEHKWNADMTVRALHPGLRLLPFLSTFHCRRATLIWKTFIVSFFSSPAW